jgi:hypothetical protein
VERDAYPAALEALDAAGKAALREELERPGSR